MTWKAHVNQIKGLLEQKLFDKAELTVTEALSSNPSQINLLCMAHDIYFQNCKYNLALQYSLMLVNEHPRSWNGYGKAFTDLTMLGRISEAFAILEQGIRMLPDSPNLLRIANVYYRKTKQYSIAYSYSSLLLSKHPDKPSSYQRVAQDLLSLRRIDDALSLTRQGLELFSGDPAMLSLHDEVRRSRQIRHSTALLTGSVKDPSFCIGGNCQVNPLKRWLTKSFRYSEVNSLPGYHTIRKQDRIDNWLAKARQSDIIMMIPVKSSYRGFDFGSEAVRSALSSSQKFIAYPNFYLSCFFPFYGIASKIEPEDPFTKAITVENPFCEYHDFLAMRLSNEPDSSLDRLTVMIANASAIPDEANTIIIDNAVRSYNEFQLRYPEYGYILRDDITLGQSHTFNHPSGRFLNEVYRHIWINELGYDEDLFVPYLDDTLNKLQLPIPSLVVEALTLETFSYPWQPVNRCHIRTSDADYQELLYRLVDLYRKYPHFVDAQRVSVKYLAADRFISIIKHKV
jgi:tetratricopeptide (TPR) repeat protein